LITSIRIRSTKQSPGARPSRSKAPVLVCQKRPRSPRFFRIRTFPWISHPVPRKSTPCQNQPSIAPGPNSFQHYHKLGPKQRPKKTLMGI